MLAVVRVVLKHQVADQVNFDHIGPVPHESHRFGIRNQVEPMANAVCTQEQSVAHVVIRLINLTRVNRQANIVVLMAKFP